MKGRGIRGLATWLMGAVVLLVSSGAWAETRSQTPPTLGTVCSSNELSPTPGSTPVSPGRWWNPARSGTGWDIHFGAINTTSGYQGPTGPGARVLSMTWFSYDALGRPTWYVAVDDNWLPRPPQTGATPDLELDLFQQRWEFDRPQPGRSDRIVVGKVRVKFQADDASRLAIQWQLNGAWAPVECLRDFGIAAQGEPQRNYSNSSVTPAYSGAWSADGTDAWSLYQTVLAFTRNGSTVYRESAILTTFDDSGQPVWLDATDTDAAAPTELTLGTARTLPYAYYYVTTAQYPQLIPNWPCDSGQGCSRQEWLPPASHWTRTFSAPSTCNGQPCMTGLGRPVVQMPANAPGNPKGQSVTLLLPPAGAERGLRKLTDLNVIHVDKVVCPADPSGSCPLSVSWSSAEDSARVRRVQLATSPGLSPSADLSSGRHGGLVDTLRAGDLVRFELVNWQGTVLHSTPSVRVERLPLRIQSTNAVRSSTVAPADVTLSAEVYGGVPPLQVEYFVDNRSIGITGDGTPHTLLWKAVGPGTYNVRFVVRDSSSNPQMVQDFQQFSLDAPAPANAPARTALEQASDSVGTLPGSFRVDESGAATYAIPLTLPPGRAGVTPQLGFQYTSQGGDGSIGRGWSLTGLSNITRCRRTREAGDFNVTRPGGAVFEDFEGITFTDSDAFCLDGQRLLNAVAAAQTGCPAVAGHTATEMRTEIDSHQRICAYRSNSLPNAGPRAFSVESKDGQRRWYGLHNGVGQPAQPSSSIALPVLTSGAQLDGPLYLWAINRSRDSVGNYIDYFYTADMALSPGAVGVYQRVGALLIHSIQYAGSETQSAAPHSEVRFTYQGGQLQRDHFVTGRRFSTSRRLQHIDVLDNSILQRRYKLNYLAMPSAVPNDLRTRQLHSLQECAPENPAQPEGTHVCLRPTLFSYGGSDPGSAQPATEHAGFDRPFGAAVRLDPLEIGSFTKYEGKKIADVDGDGLADIVWVKDRRDNESCGSEAPTAINPSATGTDAISVAFLRHYDEGATRRIRFEDRLAFCTPAELLNRTWEHGTPPDESWFLYDYNRDGKTDIFFRGESYWHGFLATGNPAAPFDLSNDLLANSFIVAGREVKFFPRPVDLNGDGLMDLVRVDQGRGINTLKARIHRLPPLGAKPSAQAWQTEIPVSYGNPCQSEPQLPECSAELVGLFDEDGFERQVDLNGDGATDLFVAFDVTARWPTGGGGGPGPGNPGFPPQHHREEITSTLTTRRMWVPMRVARVASDSIHLEPIRGMWTWGGSGRYTQHLDLNGDGLTDSATVFDSTDGPFRSGFRLNTANPAGDVRPGGHALCSIDVPQGNPGFADINGDGLPDYYAFDGEFLRAYPNTGGFEARGASNCSSIFQQEPMQVTAYGDTTRLRTWYAESRPPGADRRELLFGDWDGDGLQDLLVLVFGDESDIYMAHVPRVTNPTLPAATRRADPPGLLTAITDGLGGRTEILYRPLSHPAVYRADRTTNDGLYGRGSAVHDVRGAISVVARVETSAPGLSAATRKARLYYRYVGAKMQSGGRGLLGFREIHTIDPNHGPVEKGDAGAFALTISSYRQQFPFIGLPETTERWVVRQPWVETACFQNTALCTDALDQPFLPPEEAWPAGTARLLSDATEDYVFAWTSAPSVELVAFNGQTRAPEPVQVRRIRSQEHTYDLRTSAAVNASVQLYRYLAANGVADPYGNVLRTRSYVFSANPAPTAGGEDYANFVSRTETLNTYQNDVAAAHWYPGRLSQARVSHRRSGPSGAEIVRVSEFGYYTSGALRGLLRTETARAESAHVPPQTSANAVANQRDERLITYYQHDNYGNRTGTYTCDVNLSESTCTNPDGNSFFFSQVPLHVHRWSRTLYTSDGRFARATESPYANGFRKDSEILAHTAYGQPLLVRGLNGDYTRYAYGRFGRSFYQWTQTVGARVDALNGGNAAAGQGPGLALGVESRTHYAWCTSAGGTADCPSGAVYRQTTEGTEQPRQWAYFDALARPVLQVGELLNMDTSLGLRRSAVCQDYDVQGRGFRQSAPRMLLGSDTPTLSHLQNYCEQVPANHWTESQFDVLGRNVVQWSPEESGRAKTEIRYEGLITRTTLPDTGDGRVRERIEERNVLGELVEVRDGEGLGAVATYAYSATGDLLSVTRTAAGATAVSRMFYDRMGRKIRTEDPDAGVWNYRYNGAGELIAQYDGAYVQPALPVPTSAIRTLQEFDGRGRVIEKRSFAAGATAGVYHSWRYDLSLGGPFTSLFGVLTNESSMGGYDAGGQSEVSFDRIHHYDDLGRPVGSGTQIDYQGPYHRAAAHYDVRGRIWKTMDASHRWLKTEYGARGFQLAQCESSALDAGTSCATNHENTYIRVQTVDAWGKVTLEQRGNNLEITSAYTASAGRLISRCMGHGNCDVQADTYDWDPLGNLLWRERRVAPSTGNNNNLYNPNYRKYRETFAYDSLNRVISGELGLYTTIASTQSALAASSLTMAYDALGNICQRSVNGSTLYMRYLGSASCGGSAAPQADGGSSTFNSPHALTWAATGPGGNQPRTAYAYDAHGNQISAVRVDSTTLPNNRHVRYTAEQQAWHMAQGNELTRIFYGPDGARYKRIDQGLNATTQTLYLGNVELVLKNSTPSIRRYLAGVAMMEIEPVLNTRTVKRLLHDHLGSVSVVLSNADRTVWERYDYDAFGQRRAALGDPRTVWNGTPTHTNRGFTGHEMLDAFGIVHMNGRIYDSRTARFLQADPFVQEPNNPQNFNRFTYLWNNPLNATDPSGYLGVKERQWVATAVAIVGAVVFQQYQLLGTLGTWGTAGYFAAVGAISGGIATQSWSGAAWGAFSGAVSAGWSIGFDKAGTALWQQALIRGTSDGILSTMRGGKFGSAFAAAGLSTMAGYIKSPASPMGQLVRNVLVGGTVSAATGGKFGNGAVTAAMQAAFAKVGESAPFSGSEPSGVSDRVTKNGKFNQNISVNCNASQCSVSIRATISGDSTITDTTIEWAAADISSNWSGSFVHEGVSYSVETVITPVVNEKPDIMLIAIKNAERGRNEVYGAGYARVGSGREIELGWHHGRRIAAHEFGHLIGLRHQANVTFSLMSYNRDAALTGSDVAKIARAYR